MIDSVVVAGYGVDVETMVGLFNPLRPPVPPFRCHRFHKTCHLGVRGTRGDGIIKMVEEIM